jgi:hypothetical protein
LKLSLDNDFVLLGLLWLCHGLSIEGYLDEELHTSLLNITGQILTSHRLPVLDKMAAEAFNNLIKEAKGVQIGATVLQQQIEQIVFVKIKQLLVAVTESDLKKQAAVLETTVGAYLSLLYKLFLEQLGSAPEILTAFFNQIISTFGPILLDPSDQRSFYVFLVVAKTLVEASEISKDLNEMNQSDIIFLNQIEGFVQQIVPSILGRFHISFESNLLKSVYYQTLREIVTKFSDSDVHYFPVLFPLCLQLESKDPLKLTLLEKIILLNADNPTNSAFIKANLPALDAKLLSIFASGTGQITLSKNEDFEAEFVTLQNTLLTQYQTPFLSSPEALNKVALISELFRMSNTHGLNREVLRFLFSHQHSDDR